mmetsp:Transcript_20601/g.40835  ORF Transcript_20601/g.40835 Transcript_20601/m.40835 type:complete len:204 (-) Transcript_20601:44-655(-)
MMRTLSKAITTFGGVTSMVTRGVQDGSLRRKIANVHLFRCFLILKNLVPARHGRIQHERERVSKRKPFRRVFRIKFSLAVQFCLYRIDRSCVSLGISSGLPQARGQQVNFCSCRAHKFANIHLQTHGLVKRNFLCVCHLILHRSNSALQLSVCRLKQFRMLFVGCAAFLCRRQRFRQPFNLNPCSTLVGSFYSALLGWNLELF